MQQRLYIFLIALLSNISICLAQLNAAIIGDAIDQGNNCYTITQDQLFQAGGVWYDNPIDFDSDFTIKYQNNFGFKDSNGADGMALVFKGNSTPVLGNAGGGVGYEGITPSLVIEFDTYQNITAQEGNLGDPTFDHISIMRNGNPNHNNGASNLSGPIQASSTNPNIEDGNTHDIRIEWNATTNILSVFFDCELRITLNQDVKTAIFSEDDTVFFGFVGSTGGLSNSHVVCFNSVSFVDNLQLQDDFICLGSSKNINAGIPSGVSYSWFPTNGLSDPTIASPIFSPTITTTYTVTISDICGETTVETFTLSVLPVENPVFDPVASICAGDTLSNLPTTSNNGISGTWSPALNNTETTTYMFSPNTNQCANATTLVIDVIPNNLPVFDAVDPICPGEFLAELPTLSNNGYTGTWSPGLNNMTTTLYTYTPDAGQGCISSATLEIVVTDPIIPQFSAIEPICAGESLDNLPTQSNDGITGSWSPILNNQDTTTYTFTPEPNQCADQTVLTITIIPISVLEVQVELISEAFSDNQSIVANVSGGTGAYEYQLDDGPWMENNVFSEISGCEEHIINAREISGCSNMASEAFRILEYPKFFTPNGDTVNDLWNIDCLRDQSDAKITIYDRYGKLLTVINPSRFGWNGIYNNAMMPTDDYWFKVEYLGADGLFNIFTSHFTLKR